MQPLGMCQILFFPILVKENGNWIPGIKKSLFSDSQQAFRARIRLFRFARGQP